MKPSDDDLSRIETLALLWKQLSTLVRRSQIYYPTRPTRFSFFGQLQKNHSKWEITPCRWPRKPKM